MILQWKMGDVNKYKGALDPPLINFLFHTIAHQNPFL